MNSANSNPLRVTPAGGAPLPRVAPQVPSSGIKPTKTAVAPPAANDGQPGPGGQLHNAAAFSLKPKLKPKLSVASPAGASSTANAPETAKPVVVEQVAAAGKTAPTNAVSHPSISSGIRSATSSDNEIEALGAAGRGMKLDLSPHKPAPLGLDVLPEELRKNLSPHAQRLVKNVVEPLANGLVDGEKNPLAKALGLTIVFGTYTEILAQEDLAKALSAESPDPEDVERSRTQHERAVKGKLRGVEYFLRHKSLQSKVYRRRGPLGFANEPGLSP